MKNFTIDNETNNIAVHGSVKEADGVPNSERFSNEAALAKLAANWPAARLVEIYNTLPGETQERVQTLITQRVAFARGRSRNKHLALLSGLLYCESCATRMVYSYSGKNDRRFPYYVCLNAQRKGWAACPAKSLPARGIEESVLERIREAKHGIFDPAEWDQMDRTRQVEAIQRIVERIGYDGVARQISIRFHPAAITAGQEGGREW